MKKTFALIIGMSLFFIVPVTAQDVFLNCPSQADENNEISSMIGSALFNFLKDPEKSKVSTDEIIDLVEFYFAKESCYSNGGNSNAPIINILNKIKDVGYLQFPQGGTCTINEAAVQNGTCHNQYYCEDGEATQNCALCNFNCQGTQSCNDQTGKCEEPQVGWTECVSLQGKNCISLCQERGLEASNTCTSTLGITACMELWGGGKVCDEDTGSSSHPCLTNTIGHDADWKCCCT